MIKKLLISLMLFALLVPLAFSRTIVPVVWPFHPGSNQANALRTIIENANKLQDEYEFVFENKPGAGGAIAVREVLNSTTPKLVLTSTSVFVRVKYFPNESYDLNELQPVTVISTGSPLVVLSKKYKSLDELKKSGGFTLGVISGNITEAVGVHLQTQINGIRFIPYPGTINATMDTIGGHIDASVEFIKDSVQWTDNGTLHRIFITGKPGTEYLVSNFYLVTGKNQPKEFVTKVNQIFNKANNQENVKAFWVQDYAKVANMTVEQSEKFWSEQRNYWK